MEQTHNVQAEHRDARAEEARMRGVAGGADQRRKANLAELPLFTPPGTTKLYIEGTDYWIEVKDDLDFGEQSTLDNASIRGVQREQLTEFSEAGNTVIVDLSKQRFLLLSMYIVAWNFVDGLGDDVRWPRPIDDRIKLLRRMSPAWGDALVDMVTRHAERRNEIIGDAEKALDDGSSVHDDQERDQPPENFHRSNSSNGGVYDGTVVSQVS